MKDYFAGPYPEPPRRHRRAGQAVGGAALTALGVASIILAIGGLAA